MTDKVPMCIGGQPKLSTVPEIIWHLQSPNRDQNQDSWLHDSQITERLFVDHLEGETEEKKGWQLHQRRSATGYRLIDRYNFPAPGPNEWQERTQHKEIRKMWHADDRCSELGARRDGKGCTLLVVAFQEELFNGKKNNTRILEKSTLMTKLSIYEMEWCRCKQT